MCEAAKCVSQAVSFVFFTQIQGNEVNMMLFWVFLQTRGVKYTYLRSVVNNMRVAAKYISQVISLVFFTLITWNDVDGMVL